MKSSISLLTLILILSLGCQRSANSDHPSGVYSAHFTNEFYDTSDTVAISLYSENPRIYTIERRTGFRKIKDKATLKKQYKQVTSRMTYNEEQHLLEEAPFGRRIRYIPEKSLILIGTTEYHLIK